MLESSCKSEAGGTLSFPRLCNPHLSAARLGTCNLGRHVLTLDSPQVNIFPVLWLVVRRGLDLKRSLLVPCSSFFASIQSVCVIAARTAVGRYLGTYLARDLDDQVILIHKLLRLTRASTVDRNPGSQNPDSKVLKSLR